MSTEVDNFLAHFGVEVESTPTDEFLMHHGVPGMKWGKRKAIQAGTGIAGAARAVGTHYQNQASTQLAKNNGSKSVTITKNIGKSLATNLLINVGSQAINRLGIAGIGLVSPAVARNASSLKKGNAAVSTLLQIANTANTVGKTIAVAKNKDNQND